MISTTKLKKAMREISEKKGEFAFLGLFLRAEAPGLWDLVVSAPWLEQGSLKRSPNSRHSCPTPSVRKL